MSAEVHRHRLSQLLRVVAELCTLIWNVSVCELLVPPSLVSVRDTHLAVLGQLRLSAGSSVLVRALRAGTLTHARNALSSLAGVSQRAEDCSVAVA